MYVYAWNGSKQNAAFPGEQMRKIADKLYRYDLLTGYTNIIFASKSGESITNQTVDLTFDSSKPYATLGDASTTDGVSKYGASWSESKPDILADYYITGKIEGKEQWYSQVGFIKEYEMSTPNEPDKNLAQFKGLKLKSGDAIKAIASDGISYYGYSESNANYDCSKDGAYDVYLSKDGHIYVVESTDSGQ